MEGNNEEDYLDSLLDSVSVVKDDVVGEELFDEDTNELIGKLNDIMNEVQEDDLTETAGAETDTDEAGAQGDMPEANQLSGADVQQMDIDDELKGLIGGTDNGQNAGVENEQGSSLSDDDMERLAQMDAEHEDELKEPAYDDIQKTDIGAEADEIPDISEKIFSQDGVMDDPLGDLPDDLETLIANERGENKKGLSAFFKKLFSGSKDKKDKKKKEEKKKKNKKKNNIPEPEGEETETGIDENKRVLEEVFDENGELLEDDKGPVKKTLFSSGQGMAGAPGKMADLEEIEEKPAAKKKKEKKAKKPKKEKPKKEKKPKKPKEKKPKKEKIPPRPSELIRVTPAGIIAMVIFIGGITLFIYIGVITFHYKTNIESATAYFLEDNYDKAFDCLEGMKLRNEEDEILFQQIEAVMYVKKQYNSYVNYSKLGMDYEALDALIKGIARYAEFYEEGEALGVLDDMTSVRDSIVEALAQDYGISEALAITYSEIEDSIQYYYIISSYGGQDE